MANQGRIKFGIDFDVNKAGLTEIQSELKKIANLTQADLKMQGIEITQQELGKLQSEARELQSIFAKSYNFKLNTVDFKKLEENLKNSNINLQQFSITASQLGSKSALGVEKLNASIYKTRDALKEVHPLLDKMKETFANTIRWTIASTAINKVTGSIQQAWSFTKQLDTALNDIRIVTEKNSEEMERFARKANEAAKVLGASTRDYAEASLIYYQQGLSDTDVQARTETTLKAANVTGQNPATVSEQLTAVWNGYKVSAKETELYVDKLSAVAATTAADLEELSTGMSKVASAANIMGGDIDQLKAQLATIVSVTREAPESIGTALKTVYARMSDIQAGLDEETTLDEYTQQMAKMGIYVLDAQGQLRSMGDVVEEIGDKWNTLTRAQQTSLAQTIAGTRQYSRMMALFENWDMYNSAKATSQSSAGTLEKQNEIALDSFEKKIQQLNTSVETLYLTLVDSNAFKFLIDGFTAALEVLNSFVNSLGGARTLLLSFGGIAASALSGKIGQSIGVFAKNRIENKQVRTAIQSRDDYIANAEQQLKTGIIENSEATDKQIKVVESFDKKITNRKKQGEVERAHIGYTDARSDAELDDEYADSLAAEYKDLNVLNENRAKAIEKLNQLQEKDRKNLESALELAKKQKEELILQSAMTEEEKKAWDERINSQIKNNNEIQQAEDNRRKIIETAKEKIKALREQEKIDLESALQAEIDSRKDANDQIIKAEEDKIKKLQDLRKKEKEKELEPLQEEQDDALKVLKRQGRTEEGKKFSDNIQFTYKEGANSGGKYIDPERASRALSEADASFALHQRKLGSLETSLLNEKTDVLSNDFTNRIQEEFKWIESHQEELDITEQKWKEILKAYEKYEKALAQSYKDPDNKEKQQKVRESGLALVGSKKGSGGMQEDIQRARKENQQAQKALNKDNVKKYKEVLNAQKKADKDIEKEIQSSQKQIEEIKSKSHDEIVKESKEALKEQEEDIKTSYNEQAKEIGKTAKIVIENEEAKKEAAENSNEQLRNAEGLDLQKIKAQQAAEAGMKMVGSLMQMAGAISMIANLPSIWNNQDAEVGEKILATITTIIPAIITLGTGVSTFGKAMSLAKGNIPALIAGLLGIDVTAEKTSFTFAKLKTQIMETWGAMLPFAIAIAGVIAAISILSFGLSELEKQRNKEAIAAQEASENAAEQAKNYQDTLAAYEDLKSAIEDHKDQITALEELTYGTQEWRDAMQEANASAMELLNTYPELAKYTIRKNGALTFTDEGFEKVQELQADRVSQAQGIASYSQLNSNRKNIEAAKADWADGYQGKNDDIRASSSTVGAITTAVGGGATGAVIGSAILPGLGTVIGLAVGAIAGAAVGIGTAIANEAIDTAFEEDIINNKLESEEMDEVIKAYQNFGDGMFESVAALEEALDENSNVSEDLKTALLQNKDETIKLVQALKKEADTRDQRLISMGETLVKEDASTGEKWEVGELIDAKIQEIESEVKERYKDSGSSLGADYLQTLELSSSNILEITDTMIKYKDAQGNTQEVSRLAALEALTLKEAQGSVNVEKITQKWDKVLAKVEKTGIGKEDAQVAFDAISQVVTEKGVNFENLTRDQLKAIYDTDLSMLKQSEQDAIENEFQLRNNAWRSANEAAGFNEESSGIDFGAWTLNMQEAFLTGYTRLSNVFGEQAAQEFTDIFAAVGDKSDELISGIQTIDWSAIDNPTVELKKLVDQLGITGINISEFSDLLLQSQGVIKSAKSLQQEIVNRQKAIESVEKIGDTIDPEVYDSLSSDMRNYFILMEDGTYALKVAAEDFYKAAGQDKIINIQRSLNTANKQYEDYFARLSQAKKEATSAAAEKYNDYAFLKDIFDQVSNGGPVPEEDVNKVYELYSKYKGLFSATNWEDVASIIGVEVDSNGNALYDREAILKEAERLFKESNSLNEQEFHELQKQAIASLNSIEEQKAISSSLSHMDDATREAYAERIEFLNQMADNFTLEADPFEEINRELEKSERNLNSIETSMNMVSESSEEYLALLKEENAALLQQANLRLQKSNEITKEQHDQRRDLVKVLVNQFGLTEEDAKEYIVQNLKNGYIDSESLYDDLLNWVQGEGRETTKVANNEDIQKLLDESILSINKLQDDKNDLIQQRIQDYLEILESNFESFEIGLNLQLDQEDLKRQYNDFLRTVEELEEKNNFSSLYQSYTKDLESLLTDITNIQTSIKNLDTYTIFESKKELQEAIADIESNSSDADISKFITRAQAEEFSKEKILELQNKILEAQEIMNSLEETQIGLLDAQNEAYEKQREYINNISSLLEYQLELNQLISGENDVELMKQYYINRKSLMQAEYENLNNQYQTSKQRYEELLNQGSDFSSELDKQILNNYIATSDQIAAHIADLGQIIVDEFQNSLEIMVKNTLATKLGIQDFSAIEEEWDWTKTRDEKYFDNIERGYELDALRAKFDEAARSADDLKIRERINETRQTELKYLENKSKLTKTDIERAEKELAILQAEIALEEAQEAKTKMRLVRGMDGNYSFQYVADQDEIEKKREELEQLKYEMYTFNKDAFQSSLDDAYSSLEEFIDKWREAWSNGDIEEAEQETLNRLFQNIKNSVSDAQELRKYFANENSPLVNTELAQAIMGMSEDDLNSFFDSLMNAEENGAEAFLKTIEDLGVDMDEILKDSSLANALGVELQDGLLKEYEEQTLAIQTMATKVGELETAWNNALTKVKEYSEWLLKIPEVTSPSQEESFSTDTFVESENSNDSNLRQAVGAFLQALNINFEGLDTGGYTGEWGAGGRLALLHEKELVLNQVDTENILQAVDLARMLDTNLWSQLRAFNNIGSKINLDNINNSSTMELEQQVTIHADFPNVQVKEEIEEALTELMQLATQQMYTNNRA